MNDDLTFLYLDKTLSALSRTCYNVFILIHNDSTDHNIKIYGTTDGLYGIKSGRLSTLGLKDFLNQFYDPKELTQLYKLCYSAKRFVTTSGIKSHDVVLSIDINIVQPDGSCRLINHKYTPLVVSDSGKVLWSSITLSMPVGVKSFSKILLMVNNDYSIYRYIHEEWRRTHYQRCTMLEQKIVEYLATGLSRKDIAEKMGCSEDNIKARCANIRKKMRTSNNLSAIMKMIHLNAFPVDKRNNKKR